MIYRTNDLQQYNNIPQNVPDGMNVGMNNDALTYSNKAKLTPLTSNNQLYGLPPTTSVDTRNLYDMNTGVLRNKLGLTPSSEAQASLNIAPGATPIAGSLIEGDSWYDNKKNAFSIYANNQIQRMSYVLMNQIQDLTVTGNSTVGSQQRALNQGIQPITGGINPATDSIWQGINIVVGKSVRIQAGGLYTTDAIAKTQTILITIYPGNVYPTNGVTISLSSMNWAVSQTNQPWWLNFVMTVRLTGATGSITGKGMFFWMEGSTLKAGGIVSAAPVTLDLTNKENAIAIEFESNGGIATPSITCTNCIIEILN